MEGVACLSMLISSKRFSAAWKNSIPRVSIISTPTTRPPRSRLVRRLGGLPRKVLLSSPKEGPAEYFDFSEADNAPSRDPQLVLQKLRHIDACKAELLNHDLLRLDKLAKDVLQSSPGEWAIRFREDVTGAQSGNIEQLHGLVRRRHPSLLNLAKLLRGRESGEAEQTPADDKRKLKKQPSKDAFACYRLSIAVGQKQTDLADMLTRELARLIGQPQVSRWLKEVREWLEAGNVLPDLTADSGTKPKVASMDSANVDARARRKPKRYRAADLDPSAETQRLIAEQHLDDDGGQESTLDD